MTQAEDQDTTVELKLPILQNMELVATQTAEVVAKHMQLGDEKSGEMSNNQALFFRNYIQIRANDQVEI